MWFDTHCHLYELEDAEDAVARAREAGVSGMVVLGVDPEHSKRALELTRLDGVRAGAAFHPTSAEGWEDAWGDEIDRLLEDDRVVAVGETGIDLYWDKSFFEDQERAFKRHVRMSKEHDKPLVIHTRNSFDETATILEDVGAPKRLVFHCWSGDESQLERALSLGSMISFAGNVSYKSAEDLRRVAAVVPSERLLVETDAPYLAPVPHRGKKNEPAFVAHVGATVAAARSTPAGELAEVTTANALRFFGIE